MDEQQESNKEPEKCCNPDVIRATVGLALTFIAQGLMREDQALKYFNLKKEVFEHYKAELAKA